MTDTVISDPSMDDSALGRARVTDNAELAAYYEKLESLELGLCGRLQMKSSRGTHNLNQFPCCGAMKICVHSSSSQHPW